MLEGVDDEAMALIEMAQPYQREPPTDHLLYALRELSNVDKHRTILTTAVGVEEHEQPTLRVRAVRDVGEIRGYGIHVRKPLAEHDEVLFVRDVPITGPRPEIDVEGELPIAIAFGEDLTTVNGLGQLRDHVRWLIHEGFAPLFAGR